MSKCCFLCYGLETLQWEHRKELVWRTVRFLHGLKMSIDKAFTLPFHISRTHTFSLESKRDRYALLLDKCVFNRTKTLRQVLISPPPPPFTHPHTPSSPKDQNTHPKNNQPLRERLTAFWIRRQRGDNQCSLEFTPPRSSNTRFQPVSLQALAFSSGAMLGGSKVGSAVGDPPSENPSSASATTLNWGNAVGRELAVLRSDFDCINWRCLARAASLASRELRDASKSDG